MERKKPDFLGIGVTKAGTTWLWWQLNRHPDVWLAPEKEIHFYDRSPDYPTLSNLATASFMDRLSGSEPWDRPLVLRGLTSIAKNLAVGRFQKAAWWSSWTFGHYDDSWYVSLFSQARPDQVCGEITPDYAILKPEDIARIHDTNPDMRLILMIRDPIERAWSGLRHNVAKRNFADWNSETEILSWLKKPDIAMRGDYERIVDNYLAVFDSSQLLIGFYDAISRDPLGLMNAVTSFLGVRTHPGDTAALTKRIAVSPSIEMPDAARDYLTEEYMPMISRASKRFGSYASYWEFQHSAQSVRDPKAFDGILQPAIHA
jgi:hypothetical protein